MYSDYGAATYFTPGQIAAAAEKLKLPAEFIVYGYAMFLEQDVFEGLKPTLQNPPSYEEARIGFVPYNPTTAAADANFYESKLGVSTPADGGPGGSGF